MRLREIFRYELQYRLRSASTWIYAAILFLVAIWFFLGTADEPENFIINAPERLAGVTILVGMFGMLVSAAIFGDAALRDIEVEMDPLLFTTQLRKSEYLVGRFLAALTTNAMVQLAIPLGLMVATRLGSSFASVGPFRLSAYLQPIAVFSLPNLVVVGSVLFTIGMLARSVVPVYLAAIALFIGTVVGLNYPGWTENPLLAALADPLGIATLQETTRYWTEIEQNTRLIGLPGALLLNRVVWLAIASATLGLLARVYRFSHPDGGSRRRKRQEPGPAPAAERVEPPLVSGAAGSFGFRTSARQTLALAGNALSGAMATRSFLVVLAASLGLTMLWGWNVGQTVFDTSVWPVTFLVAETGLSERIMPFFYLVIALYAGELVWKERAVGTAEIADASPVPDGAALLGRFLALVVMIVMFQSASLLGGLLIQAFQGYYRFEPWVYLRIVLGFNLAGFLLLAALAMTVHVVVNHKYLGHIVVVMAMIFPRAAPGLGIRHPMLRYGVDPGWTYSDLNGFGPFTEPVVWFKLYWAAWAVLLMVLATALWVRGRETGMGRRWRLARARFSEGRALVRATVVGVGLILLFGGFIFYNTNLLNTYRAPIDAAEPQAEYEKRYGRFEGAAQPVITSADLNIEIYPEQRAADLRGTFHLVNRSNQSIDSIHVVVDPELDARAFSFDRAVTPVVTDSEVGYRIWTLETALTPGDSLALSFDLSRRPRGFTAGRLPTEIAGNGTSFNRRWLPFIGYQPRFEVSDAEARERFGLPPLPPTPYAGDTAALRHRRSATDADLVQVTAVLGTSADQIAITPGVLRRTWAENGRRYFQYETEKPESFGVTVLSGRYDLLDDTWRGLPLRIFHHPSHALNLARMVRSMKTSLDYFTSEFGPYPDTHLRIVERPRYDPGGSAHPNTIVFAEEIFLTRVEGDQFDMAFFGTAHEVAHTWWGGLVTGASGVRGEGLHEALANYSAMMVTETTYGDEAIRRVYDFQMDRYLSRRAEMGRDDPLLEVEDQPWIAYGKGAVALYLLREHIGPDALNRGLRRYLEKYRGAGSPYPTSLDLYAELKSVTPDSLHGLLTDLFETVTLWEVATERAVVERKGDGAYAVTLEVVARKVRADRAGRESEIPMNDMVEIGVFGSDDGDSVPLYLARHRIRSGRQTIQVTVPGAPSRAGIDPYRKLIDRQRDDNVVRVERHDRERDK